MKYNTAPIVPGRGSAIFVHVWDGGRHKAAAGCVALDRARLVALLRWLDANANPVIVLGSAPLRQPARGCQNPFNQVGEGALQGGCHLGAQEMRFFDLDRKNPNALGHRQSQLPTQGERLADPQEMRGGVRQTPEIVRLDLMDSTRRNGPALNRVDQEQSAIAADVIQKAQTHLLGFLDVNPLLRVELPPHFARHPQPDRIVAEDVVPQAKDQNAPPVRFGSGLCGR